MQSETPATVDWSKCSFLLALACVIFGWTQFKGPLIEIKLPSVTPVEQPKGHQNTAPSPKDDPIDWSGAYG